MRFCLKEKSLEEKEVHEITLREKDGRNIIYSYFWTQ